MRSPPPYTHVYLLRSLSFARPYTRPIALQKLLFLFGRKAFNRAAYLVSFARHHKELCRHGSHRDAARHIKQHGRRGQASPGGHRLAPPHVCDEHAYRSVDRLRHVSHDLERLLLHAGHVHPDWPGHHCRVPPAVESPFLQGCTPLPCVVGILGRRCSSGLYSVVVSSSPVCLWFWSLVCLCGASVLLEEKETVQACSAVVPRPRAASTTRSRTRLPTRTVPSRAFGIPTACGCLRMSTAPSGWLASTSRI